MSLHRFSFATSVASGSLLLLALLIGPPAAQAQEPPEIHDDGSVTFRLLAPNAQQITIVGDIGDPFPMTKGDDGQWSVTTEPLQPDLYRYAYDIDGQMMIDTANTDAWAGATYTASLLFVPGAESDFMALRDVPHGELHEHRYPSTAIGVQRRFIVYTPPGYDPRQPKLYPVLYLMHGRSADETYWSQVGRANYILDNLLAAKEAQPMLIVMPFGHTTREAGASSGIRRGDVSQGRAGGGRGRGGGGRGGARGARGRGQGPGAARGGRGGQGIARGGRGGGVFELDAIQADLFDDVMPLVESRYRVRNDSGGRAIAGLSMGGYQALAIGLNHLDKFDYVGSFSAALVGDFTAVAPEFMGNADASNAALKLLWLGCGDQDTLLGANRNFEAALTSAKINHEWVESPGYAHVSAIWRINLHTLLPKLFPEAPGEANAAPDAAAAIRAAEAQIGIFGHATEL